jgi:hypothetical protein
VASVDLHVVPPEEIKKNNWQGVLWTKEVIEKVVFGKA